MNPNSTVRPWLLAVGKQFGIRQAHDFRWPDAKTRPDEMYFTYRLMRTFPVSVGHHDLSSVITPPGKGVPGNDVNRSGSKPYHTVVQIDLYNSQDGLYELAAIEVAAHASPIIRQLFQSKGVAFFEAEITDETTFDDQRVDYHHRMIATFEENVEVSITEINGQVDDIVLDLNWDGDIPSQTVNDSGITLTP